MDSFPLEHMIPVRSLVVLIAVMATATAVAAQVSTPGAASCGCRSDVDSLVAKIEHSYVGWPIEYANTPREARFRELVKQLQQRADHAGDEECLFALRSLTDWFHDGHLFVFELPTLPAGESERLAQIAPTHSVDENELKAAWQQRKGRLDPIEGIWYTPGYRIAIIPDTARANAFVGVVLSSDSALWKRGQEKATFTRNADGSYRTVLRADDHSLRHMDARIYRNLLLATTPVTWGREYPVASYEAGTLDPADPTRPTLRLAGDDAVVVSVPSHDPRYARVLDSLVRAHRAEITRRPILLVDIRGDLGGGSQTTSALVPFLVTPTRREPIGPKGLSMVVSSPDNVRYFQRGWNPDSVAQRMTANPGKLLPLMRNETLGMPFDNDTVLATPSHVALLTDRGVASAGEAFVIQARQSTKVTLYGDNTRGMIDYQSVMVVRLACRERGILMGYPMIAASPTLPKDGLNAKGIPPDFRIPSKASDQVAWVLLHMRSKVGGEALSPRVRGR